MSRIFYSKPNYTPLAPRPGHPHHLLITDGHGLDRALTLRDAVDAPCTLLLVDAPGDVKAPDATTCDTGELAERLPALVAGLPAGTACYLFGREAFIWPVATRLQHLGVARDHCLAERCGPLVRDVLCMHCKERLHDVSDNLAECTGCGRLLWNYDHFSRRLGAYMGFEVNAECAADIPERETLQA